MDSNKLNLNAYGVSELGSVEMRKTNGGIIQSPWFWLALGIALTMDWDNTTKTFNDGRNAAPHIY